MSKPALRTLDLPDDIGSVVAGMTVTPFAMSHGPAGRTTGFRCGTMAYCTDVKELPAAAEPLLRGLDLLALGVLRDAPHPTHQCWDEAQAVIARLQPRRTVLMHMGPEVRFADWESRLRPDLHVAVDGWSTTFEAA